MTASFVHLHVHTDYSLIDSCVRVKSLVKATVAAGMPAVAVTDQCNLFSMVKFYRAAEQAGIKPIIGADLWLHNEQEPNRPTRILFLCQDRQGYLNLTQLVSRSYIEGQQRGIPIIQKSWLQGKCNGLIALSGGPGGDIGLALQAGNDELVTALVQEWQALFPQRYYLEVVRTGRSGEEDHLHAVVELAQQYRLPLVASNDVRFLTRDDFGAHEARVCIQEGRTLDDPRRPRNYSEQQYLRDADEMIALFADLPEAITNTVEIARRCNLELTLGQHVLPDFPVPEGMTTDAYFREQAKAGLERRLTALFDRSADDFAQRQQEYDERLAFELDVIISMGFPGYFLIVADFIQWAKDNDIPVGPGRGSGAGSLVAYSLLITNIDPMHYELLFERFLNPERVSMPDFDIDFCMEGRDRVIDYVARRYGRDQVSQIITYGTMAAKAVIRDVGRVLGHPYGFVDQIAKLIPFEIGMTLEKALEQEEQLLQRYQQDEEVRALIDLGQSLEGLIRNAGKHAGGVVIAPSALTDFTPLYCEQGSSSIVTQFDKDDVEAVGLVKFDFLGLRTLTIIDWALKSINRQRKIAGQEAIRIEAIPLDDAATFTLLQNSATTAVFQLESRGMKDLIKRLCPDKFDDIIALVALFRPGPLQSGMVDDFIERKHGRAQVHYPHPDLEPILKPTYGVILYQEQVMQIAQVLAGYSLGQADMLRRAMGKKKPEEMAKQRDIFIQGAIDRGVDEKKSASIFDLMEKFAGYGFNKSHSAAYALVSFQTAWLKTHYPAEFMAAVLSADMDNTDKVVILIDECRDMQCALELPNINVCETAFAVSADHAILYGLGAIKGVGAAALDGIIAERQEHGSYKNLFDFCRRIDCRKANRRVLEALIRAGALDVLDKNRARSIASLSTALQMAEHHSRDDAAGQNDLFGGMSTSNQDTQGMVLTEVPFWDDEQRLNGEKETLGLYLSGHPIARYEKELQRFITSKIVNLRPSNDQTVVIAGLVTAIRTMNSRRGDRIAFITLDDRSGRMELAVFSEAYQRFRDLLVKDRLLVVSGTVSTDDYSGGFRMSADEVYDIDQARSIYARRIEISVNQQQAANGFNQALAEILQPFRSGTCPVWLNYTGDQARAQMALGNQWRVQPSDELLRRLREMLGDSAVEIVY